MNCYKVKSKMILNNIFGKLPLDIIKYILLFNEQFIMRNGEMISIIPKTDERYDLLNFITFKLDCLERNHNITKYLYRFPNLHNYPERDNEFYSDSIQVNINENNEFVKYTIWICKQYQIWNDCKHESNDHIEKTFEYNWKYIQYEYTRS